MIVYCSQGLEVSWELGEEILAVRVAGEAGKALLDKHVAGLGEGVVGDHWPTCELWEVEAKGECDNYCSRQQQK